MVTCCFMLDDVRKRRMTVYIGIQPNKLAEARLIVNLFFSQLINVNTRELPQAGAWFHSLEWHSSEW